MLRAVIILFAIVISGMAQYDDGIVINGKTDGIINGKVIYFFTASKENKDTSFIEDGRFIIKANITEPQIMYIRLNDITGKSLFFGRIFAAKGIYPMEISLKGKRELVIHGSQENESYLDYIKYISSLPQRKELTMIEDSLERSFLNGNTKVVDELQNKAVFYKRAIIDSICTYSKDYRQDQVAIYNICELASDFPYNYKEEVLSLFQNCSDSYYLKEFKKKAVAESTIQKGSLAPNFQLKDTCGRSYSLKDFKGKFLFVDFSASWCFWCKKELVFIKEAYSKIDKDKVVFITINMDTERKRWAGEIMKEKINWYSLSNLDGMKGEAAKMFNVSSLPATFIISPNGYILERDVRGEMIFTRLHFYIANSCTILRND